MDEIVTLRVACDRHADTIRALTREAEAKWVFAGKALGIANMGHVNAPMILGTLSVIEMGLAPLHIPHDQAVVLSGHQPQFANAAADGAIRQWRPKFTQFRS